MGKGSERDELLYAILLFGYRRSCAVTDEISNRSALTWCVVYCHHRVWAIRYVHKGVVASRCTQVIPPRCNR